jgi:hypothetical protein
MLHAQTAAGRPLIRALALALALIGAWPATAADLYTVSGVSVDVTADSAAAAREQAIAAGHRQAFAQLMDRLVPREARDTLPDLGYDRIAPLVRDFEVANEKTSSVRYLADLTVRFQPAAVRDVLRRNQVPFAETRSKPVVVLPLYSDDAGTRLWRDPNPWRKAWSARPPDGGLVPLEVPLGDLRDIRAVSPQAARQGTWPALQQIARRHDGEDVLVARAIPRGSAAQGTLRARVLARRIGPQGEEAAWTISVRQRDGEDARAVYARAADRLAQAVERSWTRANVVRFQSEASLTARVPIDGLSAWVAVRERLEGVPLIGASTVRRLSRQEAIVALTYYGDRPQLRRALSQVDLALDSRPVTETAREGGPRWVLRSGSGGSEAGRSETSGTQADEAAATATAGSD